MTKKQSLLIYLFFSLLILGIIIIRSIDTTPPTSENFPITLSFDDGTLDQYANAFPLLSKRGMVGVFYIISDNIGKQGFMNARQLLILQRNGNEIGSHSKTHPRFTNLTEEQIRNECSLSKNSLKKLGFKVTNFRYPYAASNEWIDSIVSDYYNSGCYQSGYMDLPITTWHITTKGSWNFNLTTMKTIIDYAYINKKWININFHHIRDGYGTGNGNYEIADFIELLDYIKVKRFKTVTIQQILEGGF